MSALPIEVEPPGSPPLALVPPPADREPLPDQEPTDRDLSEQELFDAGPDAEYVWQNDALCAQTDPEAFFPEKGGSTREAKRICTACEVRSQCLAYALERDERFGIWGGLSERERRKLKRRAV